MTRPPSDEDFTAFVQAVWPRMYRTAHLMLGDHAEAEDLVQTALAKTYGSWGKVRTLDAAPAYARTAMINTASSWFRKRSWRNERPTETVPDVGHESDPSNRPAVMGALGDLPPRQRAVIVLRYYEDLSVREVAHALGCSEGTVKSQTFDALATLRTALGESVVPETLGVHHD